MPRSPSPTVNSSPLSGRPAAANRRCSTSPPACWRRRRAPSIFSATRSARSIARPATCSRPTRCFPGRRRWTTSPSGWRPRARRRARRAPRAQDWLTRVGLGAFGDRYPHMLSGGQRKRVGLAQVLIRDPKILLMDEPFGPLDAQTRQIMGNLLLDLWSADRKAVLFVTHDLEEAIALSDRVVIMSAGPAARIIGDWRVPLRAPARYFRGQARPRLPRAAPRHLAHAQGRGDQGLRAGGGGVMSRAQLTVLQGARRRGRRRRLVRAHDLSDLRPHRAAAVLLLQPGRCGGADRRLVRHRRDLEAPLGDAGRIDPRLRHRLDRRRAGRLLVRAPAA